MPGWAGPAAGAQGSRGDSGGGAIGPMRGTMTLTWKAEGTNDGPMTTSGRKGDEVVGSFTETFRSDWNLTITLDGTLAGEKRSRTRDKLEEIYSGGQVTLGKTEMSYTRTETVRGESRTITNTEKTTGPVALGDERAESRCTVNRLPRVERAMVACLVGGLRTTYQETTDGRPEPAVTVQAVPFMMPGDPRTDPEASVALRSPVETRGASLVLRGSFTYPTVGATWQASVGVGAFGGALGAQMRQLAATPNLPPEARQALTQMQQAAHADGQWAKPGEIWGVGGRWPGKLTVRWNLTSAPAELLLRGAENFDAWRPVFEGGARGRVNVTAEIKSRGGLRARDKITFSLESSHVPGKCINYPRDGGTEADLFFADRQPKGVHRISETEAESDSEVDSAEVTIESRDSGGYGKLTARAKRLELEGRDERGRDHLPVPAQDETESGIAKSWLDEVGDPSGGDPAAWDGEADPPGNDVAGDGLTLYEEYRGAMIHGKFGRLKTAANAKKKKLFVVDESGDPRVQAGIADFARLSGIEVFGNLAPSELDDSRQINFNRDLDRGHHKTDQHGVRIRWGQRMDKNDLGVAGTRHGTPASVGLVTLNPNFELIKRGDNPDLMRWAVVHELGHTVNIPHHGDVGSLVVNGQEIAVAKPGSEWSGSKWCPMRYRDARYYEKTETVAGRPRTTYYGWDDPRVKVTRREELRLIPVRLDVDMDAFCTSAAGTEDVAEKAGAASAGACQRRIQVKDP